MLIITLKDILGIIWVLIVLIIIIVYSIYKFIEKRRREKSGKRRI